MNAIIKTIGLVLICCFTASMLMGQDIIYKKDQSKLKVKVKEVGLDEIKYVNYDDQEGIVFAIAKDAIIKVKFENGSTQYFIDDFNNPDYYFDQKKHALKINFLSPLNGHFAIGYEQNMEPGRSIEARLGLVGIGKNRKDWHDTPRDARGAYVGASYKFYTKPSHYIRGMRYAHILKGSYIRPEFVFGAYSESEDYDNYDWDGGNDEGRRTVTFGGLLINFGKQWVFDDAFLVDLYFGLGYGFDNSGEEIVKNNFALQRTGEDTNLAFTGGLCIGFLLK